jgi:hypothetical protein
MLRKILFSLGIAILMGNYAVAQNATIKGRVAQKSDNSPVEAALVKLMRGSEVVAGDYTDKNGNYILSGIPSGTYVLEITSMGMTPYKRENLEVRGNITIIRDAEMEPATSSTTLATFVVRDVKPIVDVEEAGTTQRRSGEEIQNMSNRTLDGILSGMSGVINYAGGTSFRGDRPGGADYVVDGVLVSMLPPRASWQEVALLQGAIPAEYANANVIEIETKRFTTEHHGSVEANGNIQGYNGYGLEFYFTGPIAKRYMKDNEGKKEEKKSVFMGYTLSGAGSYSAGTAYRGGTYRASESTIKYLTENPLRSMEGGSFSEMTAPNVNYVTKYQEGNDSLTLAEKRGQRVQNGWGASGNLGGRVDIKLAKNLDLMLKGTVAYNYGRRWNMSNSFFNSVNNGVSEGLSWDVNARLMHHIKTEPNSKIKNVYYMLSGYYFHSNSSNYSHRHKDKLFDYGYIGTFKREMGDKYEWEMKEFEGQYRPIAVMQTPYVANTIFDDANSKNPDLAVHTNEAYRRGGAYIQKDEEIRLFGGLLNGDLPRSAYGMFYVPGVPYNGYSKSVGDRVVAKAAFSFNLKDHAIKLGFDFEQSISRGHSVSPIGLWGIMRNKLNIHIAELDLENPYGRYDEFGRFMDTIDYKRQINGDVQTAFDKNFRNYLREQGYFKNPDGSERDWEREWINIDEFDPSIFNENAFKGNGWFSPDDLFDNGNSVISFSGYDYLGNKKLNRPITYDDMKKWFDGKHDKYDFTEIGAYKPIYMAAYIQDKFTIKSLAFDLGLRLAIFNKNHAVIKDMFLYRDAYKVSDVQALIREGKLSETNINFPPSILSSNKDHYVYVLDPTAEDIKIIAYREANGRVWYDATGKEVTNPELLAKESGATELTPYLKTIPGDKDITKVSYDAFEDYVPRYSNGGVSLSPRVAFAFIVGENSKFNASYNVITKNEDNALSPITYLYFSPAAKNSASANTMLPNPSLRPEKNINYDVGFEQAITKDMKVSFQAFYSEKRDQTQAYYYNQAYPESYYAPINMDFGTSQGFIFGLEMRRIKNLSFQTNYTLTFAKGTGSTEGSSIALLRSGAPNIRTLTTLSYDQRHKINLALYYSFSQGSDYNGPTTKKLIKNTSKIREIRWFELAGANLEFHAGSGLPYTASSVVYSSIVNQGERVVTGSINGSRMPWIFNCNLTIYKAFPFVLKNSDDPRARKMGRLQITFVMQNLLQLDQITSVYPYTGSSTDDGFLTSSKYQKYISSQQSVTSFIDYYSIVMEGYNSLGGPRLFSLRVRFDF